MSHRAGAIARRTLRIIGQVLGFVLAAFADAAKSKPGRKGGSSSDE
jgi:hypothetical protein